MPQLESLYEWATHLQQDTMPYGSAMPSDISSNSGRNYAATLMTADSRWIRIWRKNAIRPFALGRRNWLYADTVKGSKASAALYSIVSTVRQRTGAVPLLEALFTELPKAQTVGDFEALLPFNITTWGGQCEATGKKNEAR